MKHKITLFTAAFSLLYAHGVIYGMEQDRDSIMKQIEAKTNELQTQHKMGNHDKCDELLKKDIIPAGGRYRTLSARIEEPSIMRTMNDPYNSLITILHAKYDNKYQDTALTNHSLHHLRVNKKSREEQRRQIEKSCQVLDVQDETITANFFLIAPNDLQFCKKHISKIKNIIETSSQNKCLITPLQYDPNNFKCGEVIFTLYPDKAELKIGDLIYTIL